MDGRWTAGQVIAVVAVLVLLLIFVVIPFAEDGGPCPPFC